MPDARNMGDGTISVAHQGGKSKRASTAGRKSVDGTHVVFAAESKTVKSIHPDKTDALEAAQGDLLKPGAEIHGVVYVPWGEDVVAAIDKALKDARG